MRFADFFAVTQASKLHSEEKDSIMWNLSKEDCFSVKSLYGLFGGGGNRVSVGS